MIESTIIAFTPRHFVLDIVSLFLLIITFFLLGYIFLKHFRGMRIPPYLIYYMTAAGLLSLNNIFILFTPSELEPFYTIVVAMKFAATTSIFLGAFELYRRFETKIS